ncbi:cysteine desulfurase [Flavobacterium arsenatis]|uniref:cysteine desulfurase n=1 Tax=Flavobacterium arsenatis TaxID=1484332 RepID=A0ABU1TN83_9FLAO|nr:cysteine desulfurase family protein [Flavobacterium arsenatis]MDR6967272.1 cysteine desulfurase [Flavobacterium arsenatis]
MKKVYLDNAATTQIRPEVINEMVKVMTEDYGNPSSTHSFGRSSKSILELSRKTIAKTLNATSQEIIFTSGATEANNWILKSAVEDLKVQRIITSKIEHHAVLHAVQVLESKHPINVDYVKIKPNGSIDINHLVELLSENIPTLVSLMHVNNEIGTVLDLEEIGKICKQYQAYFHSDTVQSIGKITFDLQQIPVDFLVASAHKFHGPKGAGFAFIRKGLLLNPLFFGGEQEKGLRPGTESVHNIVGMTKALELSYLLLEEEKNHISNLKKYTINQLNSSFEGIKINGNQDETFYNILNVCLPFSEAKTSMILFNLDMKGIAVSRGSACQSGSLKPSHVLAEILNEDDIKKPSLRISFSHFNTTEDIDALIEVLKGI